MPSPLLDSNLEAGWRYRFGRVETRSIAGIEPATPQMSNLLLYQLSYIVEIGRRSHAGTRSFREAVPERIIEPRPLACVHHGNYLPFLSLSAGRYFVKT
jgi:hypothetical protein